MIKSRRVCLLTFFILTGCGPHEPLTQTSAHPSVPTPVKTITVARNTIPRTFDAVGTVQSKTTSDLQSNVMAQVKQIHVKPGDTVTAGQRLVELDDRELTTQLQQAEGALAAAQSTRHELTQSIQAAKAAQSAAEAGRDLANATHTRFQSLAKTNAISQQVYDEAKAKQREKNAELHRATGERMALEAKNSELNAQIASAQAGLEAAKTRLSYTQILAPFNGLITAKTIEVGDMASPGRPLLQIEDFQHYRVEASVDETRFTAMQKNCIVGAKYPVIIDAIKSPPLTGTVVEIIPSADPRSRTFVLKVELPATEQLRSGMFARIQLPYTTETILTIPQSALVQRGQLTRVFVASENHLAKLRIITVGTEIGNQVEVLSGLNEGEQIIVSGADTLRDGQSITVQP